MLLVGWAGLVFAQNFSVGARLDLATGANTDLVAIGGVNVDGDSDSAPANHSANSALPFQVAAAEHGGWQLLPTSAYSLSNLVGTWQFNILASGPGAPWWARVTAEVAPDGSFTSSMTESSGGGGTTNGLFSISPGGVVTTSLSPTARGVLDAGMTVTVGTDTWAGYASGTTMSAPAASDSLHAMPTLAAAAAERERAIEPCGRQCPRCGQAGTDRDGRPQSDDSIDSAAVRSDEARGSA